MSFHINSFSPQASASQRKKLPPAGLHIHAPSFQSSVALLFDDSSSDASSSDADSLHLPITKTPSRTPRPASRNTKRLSLVLPLNNSQLESSPTPSSLFSRHNRQRRRPSIISLPNPTAPALLHRKDEDDLPSAPYVDGPIEILPNIWLGSEDNARDWDGLVKRGIKSILNVAKEVSSPFDTAASMQPLRSFTSQPNLKQKMKEFEGTYYPAHVPSGRPAMHYLKLPWSHGQSDLVEHGFITAMRFVDDSLSQGGGILIHCQCGISRSATIAIALVMRAAALKLPSVSSEVWLLNGTGMQGAYNYVKEKSKWVGPNMSLIYQLMEYERSLRGSDARSPSLSSTTDEEEWGRRRQQMDEKLTDDESEHLNGDSLPEREARALDKAMEERFSARRTSLLSITPSTGSGVGYHWHSRYMNRKRTESIRSELTDTVISEDADEMEDDLDSSAHEESTCVSAESFHAKDDSYDSSNLRRVDSNIYESYKLHTPLTARPRLLGISDPQNPLASPLTTRFSAVVKDSEVGVEFPAFLAKPKPKRRPTSLALPASRLNTLNNPGITPQFPTLKGVLKDYRRSTGKPLSMDEQNVGTPSTQTLFVFPPSPTLSARTPSAMTVTSNSILPPPHTSRLSSFKIHGRQKSFIGFTLPATPTTASSRVDARGWINARK